jgi:hypothetical protein
MAPASQLVPVLEDLAKGADLYALHGRSMMPRQGQEVSLRIRCVSSEMPLAWQGKVRLPALQWL